MGSISNEFYSKSLYFSRVTASGPLWTTMNFQFEILYFFGPTVRSRNFGGNGNMSNYDPPKSISNFEFLEIEIFFKKSEKIRFRAGILFSFLRL